MTLSDLSIKNPVFAVMLSAAMVVFGYLGYRDMGVSQFPEIDFPVVSVAITLEQASPDVMDGDVTEVVEEAVSGVEGVDYVMSQSMQGVSLVTVFFRLDRKIDVAMQDVQNAVAAARRRLPREIDPPVITKVNPNNLPVLWLTLSSPTVPLHKISDYAEKELKQQLSALPDVGGIQFAGLRSRNVRIWLDAPKMQSFNLTASDVQKAIQEQHVELPAGYVNSARVELNVRTMGEMYAVEDFKRLLVAQRNGQPVYLGQLATIEDGSQDFRTLARYNRLPAVGVGVRKAIGGNLVAVCENVKAELPRLKRSLPEGVEMHVPVDYSLFVRENIEEMKLTLFLGVALTALVCFLFLGSLGTTLNICLSIPTSLIGTFFVINYGMKLFGLPPFTINLMTLLALSLSVGIVVDDAILVLENIYRHREMGKGRIKAALEGAKEISFAAIAATLSIMAIFLPVAFMSGTIGRFFFQFGVTVGVAVFLSLLCALTLTPMLCGFFLNVRHVAQRWPRPRRWELGLVVGVLLALFMSGLRGIGHFAPGVADYGWPVRGFQAPHTAVGTWWAIEVFAEVLAGFLLTVYGGVFYWAIDRFLLTPVLIRPTETLLNLLTRAYARFLRFAMRHKGLVLIGSAGVIAVAGLFLYFDLLGQELIPSEDQSRFVIHVVCPVGSSMEHVDQLLQECEARLVERDDIAGILTSVGTDTGQLIHEADIFVHLTPQQERRRKQHQIMEEVRASLEEIEDVKVVIRDLSLEGFTAQRGDPIDFALLGKWEELPGLANEITEQMRGSGLMQDIDCDYRPGMPEEQIVPNREKLALLNVPVSRVADSMSLLVGGQRVAKFTDRGRRYDVRVRLDLSQRGSAGQIDPLTVRAGSDRQVPLGDLVTRQTVATVPVVHRFKHQRNIEITANPAGGVSQGDAIQRAQQIAAEAISTRPNSGQGFEVVELGNAQAMRDTINSLVFALVLGILIAYMILGVQFNSFMHPLVVLMALPFAVTGAFVTLWLTGDTLNMMSMIGLILLMGLVKKNSIILVDYTNQLRKEGKSVEEAVLAACPVRLRPIVMTSIATIMAAVPAAVGIGSGAETRAPMARAIIGGILVSTLVTLILVPVFYVLMERLRSASKQMLVMGDGAPRTTVEVLSATSPNGESGAATGKGIADMTIPK
jgi:multidrug efflux pump subunit AcrB